MPQATARSTHLLPVAVKKAPLTIRLPGQEDGLLQIRGRPPAARCRRGSAGRAAATSVGRSPATPERTGLIQLLRVTQAAQDGVHGAGDGLGRPILLLVLEEDLPTILGTRGR